MVGDRDWFGDMLRTCPVMAILRGYGTERTLELAHRAWDLGITLVEIPIQSDAAVETLAAVAAGGGGRVRAGGSRPARPARRHPRRAPYLPMSVRYLLAGCYGPPRGNGSGGRRGAQSDVRAPLWYATQARPVT